MQSVNAIVLPSLALIIVCGMIVLAWLIYRTPNVKKIRPNPPAAVRRAPSRKMQL
jgi:hypothetical protein